MSRNRQDPPSERSASESDAVAQIEQAMLRLRHDQARRRLRRHGRPHDRDESGDSRASRESSASRDSNEYDPNGRGRGRGRGPGWGPGGPFAGGDGDQGGPFPDGGGGPRGPRGPHDRSLGQAARFRMLDAIQSAGAGMGISALAEAIGVDQPRASRLVAEATERGHVRRAADPNDGRRSVVQLTEAGRAVLTEAHRGRRDAVATALSGFTPEEMAQFAALFTRFVEAWPRDED